MKGNLSGIILSGGRSSRMGVDKGLMNYHGKALIEYVLDHVSSVTRDIWIVSNSNIEEYKSFGFKVISDSYPNVGPIGGVHAGLSAITYDAAWVLSCDTPNLNKELLLHLKLHYQDEDVLMPVHDHDRFEPLCGIYHKSLIPRLEKNIKQNQLKLHSLISDKAIAGKTIQIDESCSFFHSDLFKNINSKEDLIIDE